MCFYDWIDNPSKGWIVNRKIHLPPNAYTDRYAFLLEFKSHFPEKGQHLIDLIGGNRLHAQRYLSYAIYLVTKFLNKHYEGA